MSTMSDMDNDAVDLYFDPNEVDAALVVQCRISRGPRAGDSTFSPDTGDVVWVSDREEPAERARVVRLDGDRIWVQILQPTPA